MTQLANQVTPPGAPAPGLQARAYPPNIIGAGAVTVSNTPTTVTISAAQLALTIVVPQSGSFNTTSNTQIPVDCTAGAATATLPLTPAVNDVILFYKFGINQFTLNLNGQLWYGASSNPTTSAEGWESIVYTGATRGWIDQ